MPRHVRRRLAGAGVGVLAEGWMVFTALQLQLLAPSAVLIQMGIEVQASLALFERIFDYLDLPQETVDVPDAITLPSPRVQGAISFRAVSFHYPTDGARLPHGGHSRISPWTSSPASSPRSSARAARENPPWPTC